MKNFVSDLKRNLKAISVIALCSAVVGCAHPISISQLADHQGYAGEKVSKTVAYVITDEQRKAEVTTPGGGGDKISYYPYRDLEGTLRSALGSVYEGVYALNSTDDNATIKGNGIELVYVPSISTNSSSESAFTWPPTEFTIDMTCSVYDVDGGLVSTLDVTSEGKAEFDEFINEVGLAAKRAAGSLNDKLTESILSHEELK
ncbi:hypothetical protein SAMN03080615_02279 [Amphritea atlantica]|uniref:Lipoprotein n=1 Tax=Amphritea atlantica TaxID=355243 RepID=A0A1H9HXE3_9GAMM|nr:hypothetical protein [Amphritea atlantica]SEQ66882.1 hypothetical protein SAMN03080615_02279 [Amphritea atlantica]